MAQKIDTKPSNYYQNTRPVMYPFIPKQAKTMLEIGCGEGMFGKYFKDSQGIEVWGIELDSRAARKAKKNINKVYVGDAEQNIKKLPTNYFDVIVANDVLEHLVDPYSLLEATKRVLKNKGVIVSSIPNMRNFHIWYALTRHRQWEYEESGILDRTHLRFFTDRSIRNMFERHGYEILQHQGIHKETNLPFLYRTLNLILQNKLSDMQYVQFATVARIKK